MGMNRRWIFVVGCVVLLLLVVGIGAVGYFLGRPFPTTGGFQYKRSPDGKWVGYATSLSEWSVLGGKRHYSELRVDSEGGGGKTIRRMEIEDTAEPGIDWRIEGEVFWSRNSSAVTFKAVTGKANLEVTMAP